MYIPLFQKLHEQGQKEEKKEIVMQTKTKIQLCMK